jgi:hypothetical protein
MTWSDYAALAAPQCALLVMNGDADVVIDTDADNSAWNGTKRTIQDISAVYSTFGAPGRAQTWFEPQAGHRPFFVYKAAVEWIHRHFEPPVTSGQIRELSTVNAGKWLDAHHVQLERLYGTELHWRGASLCEANVRYLPRDQLSVLKDDEKGKPVYTLEGWLERIRSK